jgi:hypothetical protein
MAEQRSETIVVKTRRGCNPSCCGCHCALPVLLVPVLTLLAWVQAFAREEPSGPDWTFNQPVSYSGPMDSAEWIMDAPTVGGSIATLPNYSTFPFDPNTVNGNSNPALVASDGGELVKVSTVYSIPSTPDTGPNEADGFNMAYGSQAPTPPSS